MSSTASTVSGPASSPFAAQLGTNYCPNDDEIVEIKQLIAGPSLRANALGDEIAALQKRLDVLKSDRDRLLAYVASHKALISLIRRLPLDIMQEIFVACLSDRNCVMSATEAPVLLGRICSSWRAISLSTPRLWSKLHIAEPRNGNQRSEPEKWAQRLATAEQWLARSGACALSISLECFTAESAAITTISRLFTHILIPLASRWRAVHFSIPFPAIQLLSNLTENDVPLLQDISIAHHAAAHPGILSFVPPVDMRIFRGLGITRASFQGPAVNRATEFPLRWNQLTALYLQTPVPHMREFHALSSKSAREILSRCPSLRVCSIHLRDEEDISLPATGSAIECPHLHTLELLSSLPGDAAYTMRQFFTQGISLPRLLRFRLNGFVITPIDDHPVYLAPFLASAPRLESLRITPYHLTQDTLVALIRGIPTLKQLYLVDGSDLLDDRFLDGITPTDSDDCCRELRDLVLSQCHFSDAAVLRFINAKMSVGSGHQLECFEANFQRPIGELDMYAELQLHIDAGLSLRLGYQVPIVGLQRESFSPWQALERNPWAMDPLDRFATI
ncbi:hypothetical protein FB45DRAFT_1112136 [Roridomyces roridus]|uniref:F-box domain-containing protein n=1 Tax=Roridomyces roridus TaxID=1738132 RepID=A0AAD7B8W6_9AGAR|nr:hypothetical protein FB45DRAFT_1112136 [Roridomyces roridus]